ncbi:MAG TPA: RidA family protein [Dehalococcoidia bacterium]|nr:RidA family protein [Dehalococcoidia bacterium]
MAIERIDPAELSAPGGPYVHLTKAGNLVFVAGTVAFGKDDRVVGVGDVTAQARQTLENLGACLRAAGADFSDVAKVTVFVRNMADRARIAAVRREYFKDANPASTLVEVSALAHPDLLLEIEAIAVLPG